jgi:uncharacterized membrane protein YccC
MTKVSFAGVRHFLAQESLRPDLNRALRATAGFMMPLVLAAEGLLPSPVSFACMSAQSIALVDVRGAYRLRFALLMAMAFILAGSAWLGVVASGSVAWSVAAAGFIAICMGAWRHLSPDYGPSLAAYSSLLFLYALSPSQAASLSVHPVVQAFCGAVWGLVVQSSLWLFRPQHPLRHTVAEDWVAVSDLIAAMKMEDTANLSDRHRLFAEKEAQLRITLDKTAEALAGATPSAHSKDFIAHLETLRLAAARFSSRVVAFNVALEVVQQRSDFEQLAPALHPLLTSLANNARTIALAVVSREPSHLAAADVRSTRLTHLIAALQARIRSLMGGAAEGEHLAEILQQLTEQLPTIRDGLHATIDRADERGAFSLELLDLQTWSLRPLASALNLTWRVEPALIRFTARLAVLLMFTVAIFKAYDIPRGYWLPFTVVVILQQDWGSTQKRAAQRMLGTLAGAILASLLLWLEMPLPALLAAIAFTTLGFGYYLRHRYGIAVFSVTLQVVLVTEMYSRVNLEFTLIRILCTLAGGVLALAAALVFWPVWERSRFPGVMAKALRTNATYFEIMIGALKAGGTYTQVAQFKRRAESANSTAFSSLQRMFSDPQNQRQGIERAAALANGNQRITRILTVIALNLEESSRLDSPEMDRAEEWVGTAFGLIGSAIETGRPESARIDRVRELLEGLQFPLTGVNQPAGRKQAGAYAQLTRAITELSAMLSAARELAQEG